MRIFFRAALAVAFCGSSLAQQKTLSDADGKKLLEGVCGQCHDLSLTTNHRATHDEWMELVERMAQKGANGTDDEFFAIVDYLTRHYGPARLNVNKAIAADLAAFFSVSQADAEAMVKYRTSSGPYQSVGDLLKSGADKTKIEAKKDAIEF